MQSLLKFISAFTLGILLTLSLNLSVPGIATTTAIPTQSHVAQNRTDYSFLVQQGKDFYESGQFTNAVTAWKQAAQVYQAQGDKVNQALALSNLSLSYQQLGDWTKAEDAISDSLQLLQSLQNQDNSSTRSQYAQALDIQGHLKFAQGQTQAALDTWQKSAKIYTQIGDKDSLRVNQLNRVQAMQGLGLYLQAKTMLAELEQSLEKLPNSVLKVKMLHSLGSTLAAMGELKKSEEVLQNSLVVAKLKQYNNDTVTTLLSLGNTAQALAIQASTIEKTQESKDYIQKALVYYQEAEKTTSSPSPKIQAQLNQLSLLLRPESSQRGFGLMCNLNPEKDELNKLQLTKDQESRVKTLWQEIQSQFDNSKLPNNRATTYAQIKLAQTLTCLRSSDAPSRVKIAEILSNAINRARELKDQRAESYALGSLGYMYEQDAHLYQQNAQWPNAQKLTQQALSLAQAVNAPDLAYRWYWQLGRILKDSSEGKNHSGAIAAYTQAVEILKSVRNDLLATNKDVQFSFRDDAEPVYREFVDLLLSKDSTAEPTSANIKIAIGVIDSLQLAELENFFRCNLLGNKQVLIDEVADTEDKTAAIFYPIILKNRLEVILKLPERPEPIHYSAQVLQADLEKTLAELRQLVTSKAVEMDEYKRLSNQVYKWLIQPAQEKYFSSNTNKIKTLVFVLDGSLRSIPMSALWDGKKFLIEKYAIAITPGLKLLGPKRLEQKKLKALIAGLTTGGTVTIEEHTLPSYGPLPNVAEEVKNIKNVLPDSTELLDDKFKPENLRNQLSSSSYPIIHLATHGNFSSNPQETFILTASNTYINVNDLQNLLKGGKQSKPDAIELLVFSACETAKGDKRATLGMAGVAIRSGASSAMATLWSVDDKSTALLVKHFYENLRQELAQEQGNRAEALRQAQLTLLNDKNNDYWRPYFWAPFIIIGNWL